MTTAKKPVSASADQEAQPEKPIFEYNNKTWQSYQKLIEEYKIKEEDIRIPHSVVAPEERKKNFIARVDLTQGPIERKVRIIVRFRAKNRDDREPKDYLKYYEDWYGKDWMGRKLIVSENIEGVYQEQEAEKIIRYNETKGPEIVGYERSGEHAVYTIPFSKAAVDKIIGDQDRSDIKFKVRTSERGDYFTYDEFVNYSWEQLENILMMDGGADAARIERIMQSKGQVKTANNLDFKPS